MFLKMVRLASKMIYKKAEMHRAVPEPAHEVLDGTVFWVLAFCLCPGPSSLNVRPSSLRSIREWPTQSMALTSQTGAIRPSPGLPKTAHVLISPLGPYKVFTGDTFAFTCYHTRSWSGSLKWVTVSIIEKVRSNEGVLLWHAEDLNWNRSQFPARHNVGQVTLAVWISDASLQNKILNDIYTLKGLAASVLYDSITFNCKKLFQRRIKDGHLEWHILFRLQHVSSVRRTIWVDFILKGKTVDQ